MVAPATLSLRPGATLAPYRAALPRAHAGFAPAASRPPHAVAVSYTPTRRLGSLRRAVAVDSDQQGSSEPPEQEEKPKTYYFLVANAKFMLDEEEHFQEQLAEKLRNYGERNKERDFWLVIEPKFLDRFPNITKRLKRPAVALVSTDGNWITGETEPLRCGREARAAGRRSRFTAAGRRGGPGGGAADRGDGADLRCGRETRRPGRRSGPGGGAAAGGHDGPGGRAAAGTGRRAAAGRRGGPGGRAAAGSGRRAAAGTGRTRGGRDREAARDLVLAGLWEEEPTK